MIKRFIDSIHKSHIRTETKDTTQSPFLPFLFAILLGILSLAGVSLIQLGVVGFLLVMIPSVLVSSYLGGFKSGALTTVVLTFGMIIVSYYLGSFTNETQLLSFVLLFFALLEGILISYLTDASHMSKELTELRRHDKELSTRFDLLEQKYEKALMEIRSRDEFLSIASHELKTPLTSMLIQLQTALHNIRNVSLANFSVENLMRMLDSAEKQSKRLTKMINDLLNISLITTGKLSLEPEEYDLIPLVQDVVNQFVDKAEKGGYTIEIQTDKEIIVFWDKLRIEQIFTNLLSNAIKYGNNKPIRLSVKKHNSDVRIVVSDEGIGIPSEKLNYIFGRFTRAHANQDYKGLGVGLYITYQIVTAHEGTIKVDSQEGNGTVFTIQIPVRKLKHAALQLSGGSAKQISSV